MHKGLKLYMNDIVNDMVVKIVTERIVSTKSFFQAYISAKEIFNGG